VRWGPLKRNAIAGRAFASFAELEAHLERWTREVADVRVHGTTGEAPAVRFARDEAGRLRPLPTKGPFLATRELVRRVAADCTVEVDANAYSVLPPEACWPRPLRGWIDRLPDDRWRLIGEEVRVMLTGDVVRITHAGREVAVHRCSAGRRVRVVDPAHFEGVAGTAARPIRVAAPTSEVEAPPPPPPPALLRSLEEYEAAAGGGW
jgi:hypothetical protein